MENFCFVGASILCSPFPHFLLTLLHSSIQMNSPRLYPTWIKLLSEARRTDKSPPLHVTHFNYSCPGLLLPPTTCRTEAQEKEPDRTHRQELFIDPQKTLTRQEKILHPLCCTPGLESRLTFHISTDLQYNKVTV